MEYGMLTMANWLAGQTSGAKYHFREPSQADPMKWYLNWLISLVYILQLTYCICRWCECLMHYAPPLKPYALCNTKYKDLYITERIWNHNFRGKKLLLLLQLAGPTMTFTFFASPQISLERDGYSIFRHLKLLQLPLGSSNCENGNERERESERVRVFCNFASIAAEKLALWMPAKFASLFFFVCVPFAHRKQLGQAAQTR